LVGRADSLGNEPDAERDLEDRVFCTALLVLTIGASTARASACTGALREAASHLYFPRGKIHRGSEMKAIRVLAVLAFAAAPTACGDPETTDDRGYTKAPLEHPTMLIEGEEVTAMAELREPLVPVYREVPVPQADTAAAAADQPAAPDVELPTGVTQDMVAAGETVFGSTGNCFTCHGMGGTGSPIGPPLNDAEWMHIDGSYEAIMQIVRAGVPQPQQYPAPMPAMGGAQLTDDQIRDLAAYVYTLSR
jgi:mono/diheme cytochrome c family protein